MRVRFGSQDAPVIGWLLARLMIGAGDASAHGGPFGGY